MILGNYLCTRGETAAKRLEAAMMLSVAWNVFIGTESLEQPPWNLMLNRHLTYCLCESIRSMKDVDKNVPWNFDQVMQVTNRLSKLFQSQYLWMPTEILTYADN